VIAGGACKRSPTAIYKKKAKFKDKKLIYILIPIAKESKLRRVSM